MFSEHILTIEDTECETEAANPRLYANEIKDLHDSPKAEDELTPSGLATDIVLNKGDS